MSLCCTVFHVLPESCWGTPYFRRSYMHASHSVVNAARPQVTQYVSHCGTPAFTMMALPKRVVPQQVSPAYYDCTCSVMHAGWPTRTSGRACPCVVRHGLSHRRVLCLALPGSRWVHRRVGTCRTAPASRVHAQMHCAPCAFPSVPATCGCPAGTRKAFCALPLRRSLYGPR